MRPPLCPPPLSGGRKKFRENAREGGDINERVRMEEGIYREREEWEKGWRVGGRVDNQINTVYLDYGLTWTT